MVGSDSPQGSAGRRASGRRFVSAASAGALGNHYVGLMNSARSGGTPQKAKNQDSGTKLRAAAIEGVDLSDFKTVLRAATLAAESQQMSPQLIVNSQAEHGATALHCAAVSHKPWIIKALLAAGADPNIKDEDGNTPLNLLLVNSDGDKVSLRQCLTELLTASTDGARKAVIDTYDKTGLTPLMHAVRADLAGAVLLLVENGANLAVVAGKRSSVPENLRGLTALQIAVEEDRKEVLQALLYVAMRDEQQQQDKRTLLDDGKWSVKSALQQVPREDLVKAVHHMAQSWLVHKSKDDKALLQHYSKLVPGLSEGIRTTPVKSAAAAANGHLVGDDSADAAADVDQQQQQQEQSKQRKRTRLARAAAAEGEQDAPELSQQQGQAQQQEQGVIGPKIKRRKAPVEAHGGEPQQQQQQDTGEPASESLEALLTAPAAAAEPAIAAAAATPAAAGGVTPPTLGTSSRPVTPSPTDGVTPGPGAAVVTPGPSHGPGGVTAGPSNSQKTPNGVTAGPTQSQKTPMGAGTGPGSGGTAGVSGGGTSGVDGIQKTPGVMGRFGSLTSPINIGLTPMSSFGRPSSNTISKKAPSSAAIGRQSNRLAAAMGSSGSSVLDLKLSAAADLSTAAAVDGSAGPKLSRQAARLMGATPGGSSGSRGRERLQQQSRELLQPVVAVPAAAGAGSAAAAAAENPAAAAKAGGSEGVGAAIEPRKMQITAGVADDPQGAAGPDLEADLAAAGAAATKVAAAPAVEQQSAGVGSTRSENLSPVADQQDLLAESSDLENPAAAAAAAVAAAAGAEDAAAMDVDGSDPQDRLAALAAAAAGPPSNTLMAAPAAEADRTGGSTDLLRSVGETWYIHVSAAAAPADHETPATAVPGSSDRDLHQQQQQHEEEQTGADKENRRVTRQQQQLKQVAGADVEKVPQTATPFQPLVEAMQVQQQQTRRQLQLVPQQQQQQQQTPQQQQQQDGSSSNQPQQLPAATEFQFAQLQYKAIKLLLGKMALRDGQEQQQQGSNGEKLLDLSIRMCSCLSRGVAAGDSPAAAAAGGCDLSKLEPSLLDTLGTTADLLLGVGAVSVAKVLDLVEISTIFSQQQLLPVLPAAAASQEPGSMGSLPPGFGSAAMQLAVYLLGRLPAVLVQQKVLEDVQKALQIATTLVTTAAAIQETICIRTVAETALALLSSTAAVIAAGSSSSSGGGEIGGQTEIRPAAAAALTAGKAVVSFLELLSRTGALLQQLHSDSTSDSSDLRSQSQIANLGPSGVTRLSVDSLGSLVGIVDQYKDVFRQSVHLRQELSLLPAAAAAAHGAEENNDQLELSLLLLTRLVIQQQQQQGSGSSSSNGSPGVTDLNGLVGVVGRVLDICGGSSSSELQDLQLEVIEGLNGIRDSLVQG